MFIKLTLRHNGENWVDDYFANPAHIVDMHRQRNNVTCLKFVDGSEIYVAETPAEIMQLMGAEQ